MPEQQQLLDAPPRAGRTIRLSRGRTEHRFEDQGQTFKTACGVEERFTGQVVTPGGVVTCKKCLKPAPTPRRERDAYYTPEWGTATLIERAPEVHGIKLLDPSCGDGRMAAALLAARRFERVLLNDIDEVSLDRATAAVDAVRGCLKRSCRDALDPVIYSPPPCWVVTNLPWDGSGPMAWMALERARRGVALLQRITWLEPCEGRLWLKRLPPTRQIVLPRISYDGSGSTDSATSAWFIWERDPVTGVYKRGSIEVAGGDVGQEALAL